MQFKKNKVCTWKMCYSKSVSWILSSKVVLFWVCNHIFLLAEFYFIIKYSSNKHEKVFGLKVQCREFMFLSRFSKYRLRMDSQRNGSAYFCPVWLWVPNLPSHFLGLQGFLHIIQPTHGDRIPFDKLVIWEPKWRFFFCRILGIRSVANISVGLDTKVSTNSAR